MKQLEPILKHHFWILLGVAVIMAFTGWWLTTGQMQAAIETRKKAINDAEAKIPKSDVAGKDWEVKLKAINEAQDRLVRETRDGLYARQKERMVWPEVIQEVASKLKYRDEFTDVIHHINYRDTYMNEVLRVYAIPRPLTPNDANGVVVFPLEVMPHRVWEDHTPTTKQMWDSMEDLWLLEPILQAVLEVNGGPEASRYDASILVIEQLKLKGGDRSKIGQSGELTGGGGGTGGPGGGAAGIAAPPGGFGIGAGEAKGGGAAGGGSEGFGQGAGGGLGGSIDFKDTEVFGDPGSSSDDAGGGSGPPAGQGGVAAPVAGFSTPAMDRPGDGGPRQSQSQLEDVGRRYIDDDKTQPYRTRGFKMTVIMDHRKVPDLYAELTSSERSPWPIQIVRMHVGRLTDSGGMKNEFMSTGGGGIAGGLSLRKQENGPAATAPAGLLSGFGGGEDGPRGAFGGRPPAGMLGGNEANSAADLMENPFLARVTLAGIITLYNEPEKKDQPASASPSTDAAPTAAVPEAGTSAEPAGGADDADADAKVSDDETTDSATGKAGSDADEESMSDDENMPKEDSEDDAAPESDDADSSDQTPSASEDSDDEDSAAPVRKPSASKSGK